MPSPPPHKSETTSPRNSGTYTHAVNLSSSPGLVQQESVYEVIFPDPNLEAAIRAAINKPEGPFYIADLVGLKRLYAQEKGIKDITGLEYCYSLEELNRGCRESI